MVWTFKSKSRACFFVSSLLIFFLSFSFPSFSHEHGHSEQETSVALEMFEKAILLSPDFLNNKRNRTITPYYKLNGHKIYFDDGFWSLTKMWIRLYIQEIEKHCSCDLNPDLIIQEAKDYLPQSLLEQKVLKIGKKVGHWGQDQSYIFMRAASRYGHAAATLKLNAEIAETALSLTVGGKGIHIICNTFDVLIFPVTRISTRYARGFLYGMKLSGNKDLSSSVKMAWFARQVRKSRKRVFFHIDQALAFREQELAKINREGPKSLFHKKGHRLLWLERLKKKTDPLLEEMGQLKSQLQDEQLSSRAKKRIAKKIRRIERQIENISQVNRKDFFGKRFKRYLLLKSRKHRKSYMSGHNLWDEAIEKSVLWPLSLQEGIVERVVKSDYVPLDVKVAPDEIRDGLIEEFLSKREKSGEDLKDKTVRENQKEIIQGLLSDIEQIFDTNKSTSERLAKVYVIEGFLGILFAKYIEMSSDVLLHKHKISFFGGLRLHWIFGRLLGLVDEFSDFLFTVSIIKDKKKIQFYKYKSMEKLLAFLDYLHEVQILLKDNSVDKKGIFERLNAQNYKIRTISLLKEKKISSRFSRLLRKPAKCEKLVEKYQ